LRIGGSAHRRWFFKSAISNSWRDARVVEWDGLENRFGACPQRGFESHSLRLKEAPSINRGSFLIRNFAYFLEIGHRIVD
jgi:hypothetical protein